MNNSNQSSNDNSNIWINNIEDKLNTNYIESYKKLSNQCKDSILSVLFYNSLADGKNKIFEIYQIDVNLIEETCGDINKYSEMLFFALLWKKDSSFEYIALEPGGGDVSIFTLEEISWQNKTELLFHWGKTFKTDILPLINSKCFIIDIKYAEYNGTKDGVKIDEFPNELAGFWYDIYSDELRGMYEPCIKSKDRLSEKKLNNPWIFSKNEINIMSKENEIILDDSIVYSSDTMYFINSKKTFIILANSDSLLYIKSAVDSSKLCLKKK